MTLEARVADLRTRVRANIVWNRSLDQPYRVWQHLVDLLEGVARYVAGEAELAPYLEAARASAREAAGLPKARRDPDFRIMCDVLLATADAFEALSRHRPAKESQGKKKAKKA